MSGKAVRLVKMSPSNADKWLNCPGYAQAAVDAPQRPPDPLDAAAQGTAAHKLFEVAAIFGVAAMALLGMKINEFIVDEEMAEAVQHALNWIGTWHVNHPNAFSHHERYVRLQLGDYMLTGTTDFIAYDPSDRELLITDYKHGVGYVEAIDNPQVGLYLLAGYMALKTAGHKPKTLRGAIAQPRAVTPGVEPIRVWETSPSGLKSLYERAIEAVHDAHTPGAPRRAGPWCKWCAAAPTCRELAEYSMRTAMVEFEDITKRSMIVPDDPTMLTSDALAYILQQAPVINAWLHSVATEAERRLIHHEPLPGFKLVAGRSIRKWVNEAEVLKVLKAARFPMDEIAPRALLGPAPILPKVRAAQMPEVLDRLNQLVTKTTPTLTVAPESDPRPALAGKASLEFKPIGGKT